MKELAERLGVTTGTLTVAVDKLEKPGLVERKPHDTDRRSYFVILTDILSDLLSKILGKM